MKIIGIAIFVSLTGCKSAAVAQRYAQACVVNEAERAQLMTLDYKNFDQNLPEGGWRKFGHCQQIAASLLDEYLNRNGNQMTEWQANTVRWHAGQMHAMIDDYPTALQRFERTFLSEKTPELIGWNHYVRATIAFLKKDRPALIEARDGLANRPDQIARMNLRIVESFVRCFERPYKEAYNSVCQSH